MFTKTIKFTLMASAALFIGCASQPRISAQSRDGADFTQYRTYGWISPLATDNAGYSTIITSHFKAAVQQEMQARGYVYSATDPDLQVNFFSNVENRSETRSSPSMSIGYFGYRGRFGYGMSVPVYSNQVETRNYKVGTVSIDVVDARRKELIWSGVLEGALSNKAMDNPAGAIRSAVSQIFSRYPVARPASAPSQ
jgi:hypothetical protein